MDHGGRFLVGVSLGPMGTWFFALGPGGPFFPGGVQSGVETGSILSMSNLIQGAQWFQETSA